MRGWIGGHPRHPHVAGARWRLARARLNLAGYKAKTMAAIGKATVIVEEQQNWGSN